MKPKLRRVPRASRLTVRKLTDEELLEAVLSTSDPLRLSNLTNAPPSEDAHLQFEMTYEAPKPVRCVWGHLHKKGLILKDEKGYRYPIGHDCGKERFGLDWPQMENERKRQKERQGYLLQVRGLGEAIREHQSWIAGLSNQQAVLAHGRLRRELRRKALPLVEELARLVSSGSVLYHSVEERDYEAENRRDRELDRASSRYDEMSARAKQAHHLALLGRKKALYHQVPQPLGHLRGRSLVLAQEPLAVRLTAHSTRFDALAETALRLPAAADLKGLARTGHNLLATLGDLLGEIDDARAFFTPQHLEWIGLWWVETNSDDTVKAIMGGLGIIDADGDVRAEIVMPAELRPIDRAPLEDMTRRFAGKVSA